MQWNFASLIVIKQVFDNAPGRWNLGFRRLVYLLH